MCVLSDSLFESDKRDSYTQGLVGMCGGGSVRMRWIQTYKRVRMNNQERPSVIFSLPPR